MKNPAICKNCKDIFEGSNNHKMEFCRKPECREAQYQESLAHMRDYHRAKRRSKAKKRRKYVRRVPNSDPLRPCPVCGIPTVNHYRCPTCWDLLEETVVVDPEHCYGRMVL